MAGWFTTASRSSRHFWYESPARAEKRTSFRVRVAGSTIAFWTDKPTPFESIFGSFIDDYAAEDPATLDRVQGFWERLRQGREVDALEDANVGFHVLGISPNASRPLRAIVTSKFSENSGFRRSARLESSAMNILGLDVDITRTFITKRTEAKGEKPNDSDLPMARIAIRLHQKRHRTQAKGSPLLSEPVHLLPIAQSPCPRRQFLSPSQTGIQVRISCHIRWS